MRNVEIISCPNFESADYRTWATEIGFTAVRCAQCVLIYVNPRPKQALISSAVQTGAHSGESGGLVVVSRRIPQKVGRYKKILGSLFADIWSRSKPVSWLDVGTGFGEINVSSTVNSGASSGLGVYCFIFSIFDYTSESP